MSDRSEWTYRRLSHPTGIEASDWHGQHSPALSTHFHEEPQLSIEFSGRRRFEIGSESVQIDAGSFPLRLAPDDWQSGEINWLIDVIAPDKEATLKVISNFGQVVKGGALKIHPLVTRLVEKDVLQKMGAERLATSSSKETG